MSPDHDASSQAGVIIYPGRGGPGDRSGIEIPSDRAAGERIVALSGDAHGVDDLARRDGRCSTAHDSVP